MGKSLYTSLALLNIKKNYRTIIPYILTCSMSIMMYAILDSLRVSALVLESFGSGGMTVILLLGRFVVGFFSILFIFYTSSFLIKKRMKEFGVYNVLGLEKKHLVRIVVLENVLISSISLISGVVLGVIFSKVSQLFLFKLVGLAPSQEFTLPLSTIFMTILIYSLIFVLVICNMIRLIIKSNPIELIRQEAVGEKEPKANWLIALVGIITLGGGYYLAQSVSDPMSAIFYFFLAVILVIIGTFCVFTSGSVALLKLLKQNKKIYYKPNNFVAISGLVYRMKRNAAGLANICILSTCVLVIVSTTFSLYFNINNMLDKRFTREVIVTAKDVTSDDVRSETDSLVQKIVSANQASTENSVNYVYKRYLYSNINGVYMENDGTNQVTLIATGLADYNRLTGQNIQLDENQLLVVGDNVDENQFVLHDTQYDLTKVEDTGIFDLLAYYTGKLFMVVTSDLEAFTAKQSDYLIGSYYTYMFDVDDSNEIESKITNEIRLEAKSNNYQSVYSIDSRAQNTQSFFELYGSLLFIGIILSALFLLTTVLIIYYKQISEGYEDVKRYDIMKKVGMTQKEVASSIGKQILMVFFIPIVMASIHIGFGFKMIALMVSALSMSNTSLYVVCTIVTVISFSVVYGVVYVGTSKVYYKIVNQK